MVNSRRTSSSLEAENSAQALAKLNHRLNPGAYPADGSDLASLVTIDDDELKQLLDDNIQVQY